MFSNQPGANPHNRPRRPAAEADGDRRASGWTPQRERRAVRLYLVEGFTAEDVAYVLGRGLTRAAVIGKMRRLGCLKRDVRGGAAGPAPERSPRKPRRCAPSLFAGRLPPQRPPQPLPPLREVGPTGSPATLACLPAGACRWPIDDPGAGRMHLALFCGGAAGAGVYCAAHRALAAWRPA